MAPSDFHLFPGLKNTIELRHVSSDAGVIVAAQTWLDGHPSEFFLSILQKFEQLTKKYTDLRGEYVE